MVAEQDQVRHDSAVNQMYQMYGEHSKASGSACMGMPGLVMQLVCFQVLGKLLLPSEARESLQQAMADVPSNGGHNTAATTAQSAGQTANSEDDLADSLLDDGNQSEWEARADFTRRLSMLPRDSFLELGMGNGAQAEWEARALWRLDSRRASQEQPLHTPSSGLSAAGPVDPFSASSNQLGLESNVAFSQDDKDMLSGPDLDNMLTAMSTDVGVKAGRSHDSSSVSTALHSSSLADSVNVPWAMSTLHDDESPLSVNNGTCQDAGDVAAAAASEQPANHSVQLQTRAVSQLDMPNESTADCEESRLLPAATGSQAVFDFQPLSLQHLLGPSLLEPQPEPQAALSMAQQPTREGMQVQGASLQSQFHPHDSTMGQQSAVANQTMAGLSCTGSVHSDEHVDRLHSACVSPAATSHCNGGDALQTSQAFVVPSWHGLPSSEPTSSVLNSMSIKQDGESDRAFDGWSGSASTQLDAAHKEMLTAMGAQQSWHPGGHSVSRLLARSTLQASSSSDASGSLPPAASARRFTEQPGHPGAALCEFAVPFSRQRQACQQRNSWGMKAVSGASLSDVVLSDVGLLLESGDGGKHGLTDPAKRLSEATKEHNNRAGASATSNVSVEGLQMGDTGVIPTVRAAFHQEAATLQQQMQTDLPLAHQDAGPTGSVVRAGHISSHAESLGTAGRASGAKYTHHGKGKPPGVGTCSRATGAWHTGDQQTEQLGGAAWVAEEVTAALQIMPTLNRLTQHGRERKCCQCPHQAWVAASQPLPHHAMC
ncbi:hypothetical protein WJX79_004183 [Trebouxia sp. C0005]